MPLLIDQWLMTHRAQRLNSDKTRLISLRDGIAYLGYHLRQVDSASEPLQVFSEPIKKWKWVKALQQFESAPFTEPKKPHILAPLLPDKLLVNKVASLNSRLGVLHHCRSYLFRRERLSLFFFSFVSRKMSPRQRVLLLASQL